MIETKHLELILAVDELGTLARAGERLHLTASALSHQLRRLEDGLRTRLFHRADNRLHFTEAGEALRDTARAVLRHHDDLRERLRELREADRPRYIHGYSPGESRRLVDQAATVADLLHDDSRWPAGAHVLEVGCGVGAQTVLIAALNPECRFTCIDVSAASLAQARAAAEARGLTNVEFRERSVFELGRRERYDHAFVCFVLEHLDAPGAALAAVRSALAPGGTVTVVEGDHGSTFFHPASPWADALVAAQVELQRRRGGNANIGRELYPLLQGAGYGDIGVRCRQVYVDDARPDLKAGFIRDTFTAMIRGVVEEAVASKLVTAADARRGIDDLLRTLAPGGTFAYTFLKAVAQA